MSVKILAGVTAALLFVSQSAANATIYTFDSSALGIAALITTSDTLNSAGGYDVLNITGTLAGFSNIVGVASSATTPGQIDLGGGADFLYDNTLFPSKPYFDALGVAFQLANGQLGLFSCVGSGVCDSVVNGTDPNNYELVVGNPSGQFDTDRTGSAVITAVPEASTWAMLVLGFFGIGLLGRRRSQRNALLSS